MENQGQAKNSAKIAEQLGESATALGKAIEQVFEQASRTLHDYAETMKTVYAEHKDEIDEEAKQHQQKLKELQKGMPKILVGDLVRINSAHSSNLYCYEVDEIRKDCVVSNPADFHHRYNEIIAIYRFDGADFKCIWERKDYTEFKSGNGELL